VKKSTTLSFAMVVLAHLPFTGAAAQVNLAVSARDIPSADVIPLKTTADLVLRDLGLGSKGQVVFTLQNRGDVTVNASGGSKGIALHGPTISTPPIRIDVYVGGTLIQTVYQAGIGARQAVALAVTPNTAAPKCSETRAVKVVVDPQNVVPEFSDANNSAEATAPRPCPDLAVQSIDRQSSGIAGETYEVKVTVVNKGTAPSPPDQAWGTALTSAPGLNGWPEMVPMHTIPALAPGETYSFHVGGSVLAVAHSWVEIYLDINRLIEESDESNNFVKTKI
jgi:subtilase family serine protease